MKLTRAEQAVLKALRTEGRYVAPTQGRKLRAEVLRVAVLRRPLDGEDPDRREAMALVDVRGLTVVGLLDLSDIRGADGGAGPALRFENCVFPDGLDLTGGRFAQLSVRGSRFPFLRAERTIIEGAVDLSGVSTTQVLGARTGCVGQGNDAEDGGHGLCHVSMEGAVVEGDITAPNAKLCGPPKDPAFDASGGVPYAFKLAGARVAGSLLLQPGFVATGGLDLSGSHIGGTVWMQGGQLCAEWSWALNAQMAKIGGSVALSALFRDTAPAQAFVADGGISLYGATVEGELYMVGARLKGSMAEGIALNGYLSKIANPVRVSVAIDTKERASSIPFEATGQVSFSRARIGGFDAAGGVFDGSGEHGLSFDGAHIDGDFLLTCSEGLEHIRAFGGEVRKRRIIHRSLCVGGVSAQACRITGRLALGGVRIDARGRPALDISESEIGKSLTIQAFQGADQLSPGGTLAAVAVGAKLGGAFWMTSVRVRGEVRFSDLEAGDGATGIMARGVRVEDVAVLERVDCRGGLNLYGAEIGKGLSLLTLKLKSTDPANGLNLRNLQSNGPLRVDAIDVNAFVSATGARVHGDVHISGRLGPEAEIFELSGLAVEGDFKLEVETHGRTRLDYLKVGGLTTIQRHVFRDLFKASPAILAPGARFGGGLTIADKAISLRPFPDIEALVALRVLPLTFYPGWSLVEGLVVTEERAGIASYLWDGQQSLVVLFGGSSPVADFNAVKPSPLKLTEQTVADYVAFYMANVWGSEGGFRVLRDAAELTIRGIDPTTLQDRLAMPVTVVADGWEIKLVTEYAGRLEPADMKVFTDGKVEMAGSHPFEQTPLTLRRYDAPLRTGPIAGGRLSLLLAGDLEGARAWPAPSPTYGVWRDLAEDPIRSTRLAAAVMPSSPHVPIRRLRECTLDFYPGWRSVQALVDGPEGQSVLSWLWDGSDRAFLLEGTGGVINAFNRDRAPVLETDEQAKAYVRFFCTHVWGDEGPFVPVDDADDLPFEANDREDRAGAIRPLRIVSRSGPIEVEATIAYGQHLFAAKFAIHSGGAIEMIEDEPLPANAAQVTLIYRRPYTLSNPPAPNPPTPTRSVSWPDTPILAGSWKIVDDRDTKRIRTALTGAQSQRRTLVDLTAAHADFLEDGGGERWGRAVRLLLSGFTYDQIDRVAGGETAVASGGETLARRRRRWLALQFERTPLGFSGFDSHPHAQLAAIYRASGRTDEAREILSDKIALESRLKAWDFRQAVKASRVARTAAVVGVLALAGALVWPPFVWIGVIVATVLLAMLAGPTLSNRAFGWGFGYGLYTRNALVTFTAFIVLGWLGVAVANRQQIGPPTLFDFKSLPQVMLLDVAMVNDAVIRTGLPERPLAPVTRTVAADAVAVRDIPCGTEIDPFLYAADVFIPLIDLRQEGKCSPNGGEHALAWQWAKALYAFAGWLVTSLTVLTVSGVMRSRSEH